jgi:hypothetical protein
MEELTALRRRYAHLHTPTHLTNPDHLVWQREPSTAESGGSRLHVTAQDSAGRPKATPARDRAAARTATWISGMHGAHALLAAQSRTPAIAVLYGARLRGIGPKC